MRQRTSRLWSMMQKAVQRRRSCRMAPQQQYGYNVRGLEDSFTRGCEATNPIPKRSFRQSATRRPSSRSKPPSTMRRANAYGSTTIMARARAYSYDLHLSSDSSTKPSVARDQCYRA